MKESLWILVFLPWILSVPTHTNGRKPQHENKSLKLFKELFGPGYCPEIIPLCDGVDKVTVRMDVALRELVELDEKRQLIRLKIWVRLRWKDCSLRWNASEFNGIESITVPYKTLWIPDITLYEGSSDEENMPGKTEYFAQINSDGNVIYNFPSIITSACRIDVTFFPYDYQNCSLTFGSWTFHGNKIDIESVKPFGDTDDFVSHNEWDLISVQAIKHVLIYNCCPEPYPDITYYVYLSRFPKFYILTVFIPCCIISILSIMGFLQPPKSDDKITIQITVLLSIVVFLLLVQDKLPSSSDTFPYLGVYFMTAMCLVSFSCTMSGIIKYAYFRRDIGVPVPVCLEKIFLHYMCKVLCVSFNATGAKASEGSTACCTRMRHDNAEDTGSRSRETGIEFRDYVRPHICTISACNGNDDAMSSNNDSTFDNTNEQVTVVDNYEKQWEHLSLVLDRLCLIIYIISVSINMICFFVNMGEVINRI